MNTKKQIEQFWANKETENKSKLIISTAAKFSGVFNDVSGEIDGLLYLMENGIYFENFKNNNLFRNILLPSDFKKTELFIPLFSIIKITDINGLTSKSELSLLNKLLRFFMDYSHKLIITYKFDNKKENKINFYCLDDPLIICEKYYNLIK